MPDANPPVLPEAEGELRRLAGVAADQARAVRDPTRSASPGGLLGLDFDPDDPSSAFGPDRSPVNAAYEALLGGTRPGGVGRAASLSLQCDLMATFERARRLRHASPIRCAAHAAGRRAGHGSPRGVFTGQLLGHLGDLSRAATRADTAGDA